MISTPFFRLLAVADPQTILSAIRKEVQGDAIGLAVAQGIASQLHCSLYSVESMALEQGILPERHIRNGLSCKEQLTLLQSTVAIIGCGGLGGRCAEILARLGVGHLLLTDPDSFSESNLNRQIFCNTQNINVSKVAVLARELPLIHPAIMINSQCQCFDKHSIKNSAVVVDALDSAGARKKLSALCGDHAIPLVHSAVNSWYGKIGLDRQVTGSLITSHYPQKKESQIPHTVLPITVALVAAIQASEVCKRLLKIGSALDQGWLQTDLLTNEFTNISLKE